MSTTASAEHVGVVGSGGFAVALANVLARRGPVTILAPDERGSAWLAQERRSPYATQVALGDTAQITASVAELAGRARLVFLAVGSPRLTETLDMLGPALHGGHLLVHTLGALLPDGSRVSEHIRQQTPVRRWGVLAGPAVAQDLLEGLPSALVVASAYDEVARMTRSVLHAPPGLRVYRSRDPVGVELASALAGPMTIAAGLSDGLGMGAGPRAFLFTRAIAEAARLGVALGGTSASFTGLAGLGTLLGRATSLGDRSDDYRLGVALARGETQVPRGEGVRVAQVSQLVARQARMRTPILDAMAQILTGQMTPADAVRALAALAIIDEVE